MNVLKTPLWAAALAGSAIAQTNPPQVPLRLADPRLSHETTVAPASMLPTDPAPQDWRQSNRQVQTLNGHRGHLRGRAVDSAAPAANAPSAHPAHPAASARPSLPPTPASRPATGPGAQP